MDRLQELTEKRGDLAAKIQALAVTAKDGWTNEQRAEFDKVETDYETTVAQQTEILEDRKRIESAARVAAADERRDFDAKRDRSDETLSSYEVRKAFGGWLSRSGDRELMNRAGYDQSKNELAVRMAPQQYSMKEYENGTAQKKAAEWRASEGIDQATEGAELVPEGFWPAIEVSMLGTSSIRQRATVLRTESAGSLKLPTSNDTGVTGELVAEESAATEATITTGAVTLEAYQYSSKIVRVNKRLLLEPAVDIPTFVGNALGVRLGRIQNTHFTTGDGSSKPSGVTVGAGDSGVTLASATIPTYAELVSIQGALDMDYENLNPSWEMHKTWVTACRKIVDGSSRPIWTDNAQPGEPALLLGAPVYKNSAMPTATATKVIVYGNMAKYVIRDMLDMTLVRMDERYAEYGEVAFLAWWYTDGHVLDAGTDPLLYATAG